MPWHNHSNFFGCKFIHVIFVQRYPNRVRVQLNKSILKSSYEYIELAIHFSKTTDIRIDNLSTVALDFNDKEYKIRDL